mmetsp:Transcript_13445/g.17713  ORF Transcript_13445/g.17713 Transcript_13445/m.17713 type:complete len:166 (+) Transcript_13445:140-637(+)
MASSTGMDLIDMYTDETGHTRFARMCLPLCPPDCNRGSLGVFSKVLSREDVQFAMTPIPLDLICAGDGPSLRHTAPRQQLVLNLRGYLEFKSVGVAELDAEHKVLIGPGDVLLAEDLDGEGHCWRFIPGPDGALHPWVRAYVHLGEEYENLKARLRPSSMHLARL